MIKGNTSGVCALGYQLVGIQCMGGPDQFNGPLIRSDVLRVKTVGCVVDHTA